MTPRPRPTTLLAAAAGLLLGACGGSLYGAGGVPKVDVAGCTAPQHVCGGSCVPQSVTACGAACASCSTDLEGAAPACDRVGNDWQCGYTCGAGWFTCRSGCCRATAVAAGGDQACAVTSDGSVQCWGANESGQLGRPGAGGPQPQQVGGLSSGVSAVAVGGRHACAIRSGTVWCWGADELGQLGDGPQDSSGPVPVSTGLAGATRLAAGKDHTCALVAGSVRCWGANGLGQLGVGTTGAPVPAPAASGLVAGVEELAGRADTTCARVGPQAWCWGANGSGQVGAGATSASVATPAVVAGLPGPVASLAVGGLHACAVIAGAASSADDGLTCWGENAQGQLGTGAVSGPALAPVPASKLDNTRRSIRAIAGTAFTCTAKDALELKCGGRNDQAQAGGGADPMLDGGPVSFGGDLVAAAAGADHACALADVTPLGPAPTLVVKCWGRNAEGQLGRATTPAGSPDGTPATVGE